MGFWIRAKPDFSKHIFLRVFEKWDPDIFSTSDISKISCSSHSENAHIKLNGFQSIFGGWGGPPFFFMGWMLRFGRFGPLPGSAPTHPSCLSTRGGAIGSKPYGCGGCKVASLDSAQSALQPAQALLQLLVRVNRKGCLLYTSPSPRDATLSRMPSSA